MTALVEVLHERDPDGTCKVRVWLDDVEVDDAAVELVVCDVDPGRGWDREDWNAEVELAATSCPTCKARVHAWLPHGKRGAHAEVRALHEAVLSHLREPDTGCAAPR